MFNWDEIIICEVEIYLKPLFLNYLCIGDIFISFNNRQSYKAIRNNYLLNSKLDSEYYAKSIVCACVWKRRQKNWQQLTANCRIGFKLKKNYNSFQKIYFIYILLGNLTDIEYFANVCWLNDWRWRWRMAAE